MSSIWRTPGRAVGGVVSVLFTSDRRVFFEHDDGTIRIALDWERDEVLLQMLSWQAAPTRGVTAKDRPSRSPTAIGGRADEVARTSTREFWRVPLVGISFGRRRSTLQRLSARA